MNVPRDVADIFLLIHHHAQLAGSGSKHVERFGEAGQLLSWGGSQDDGPAAGLGDAVLTGLASAAQRLNNLVLHH